MPTHITCKQDGAKHGLPADWWTVYRNEQPVHHWPTRHEAEEQAAQWKAVRSADELFDWELIQWATQHGWSYFHINDQLRSPEGAMTSTQHRSNIGAARRQQIIKQMKG